MKKVIAGGFSSLIGSIWTLAILIAAGKHPVSHWHTPPGRLLSSVMEMNLLFPLILFVLLFIFGLVLMFFACFQKDR